MKKLLCLLFLAFLISCGPGKTRPVQVKKTFGGNWALESITYPTHDGLYNVTLFNTASADCFRNSLWTLNEETGTYSLQGEECARTMEYFKWQINRNNDSRGIYDLLLIPANSRFESTTGVEGFQLNVLSLSENNMVWEQSVILEGRDFVIRMEFIRL
jgi:hypothetical protein